MVYAGAAVYSGVGTGAGTGLYSGFMEPQGPAETTTARVRKETAETAEMRENIVGVCG